MLKLRQSIIITIALNLFCTGCALLPYSPHTEMVQTVESHVYARRLPILKENVIAAIPTLHSSRSPRIFIYKPGGGLQIHDVPETKVQWEKGFTYKGKFYQTAPKSIDVSDVVALKAGAEWKNKVESFFHNGEFHILEDNESSFTIVRGNEVFIGKAAEGGSRLEVYTIPNYHRGPIRVALDLDPLNKESLKWWEFLRLNQDPIVFETSFKDYAVKKPERALAAMYLIDPDFAQKTEADLRAKHIKEAQSKNPYL